MKRVRGDKDNPKSLGYICQKAGRLPFYANDRALRLTSPLRRNAAGGFDEITWDVAIAEIAGKLNVVRETCGAQTLGYYGGGGHGSVMGGVPPTLTASHHADTIWFSWRETRRAWKRWRQSCAMRSA